MPRRARRRNTGAIDVMLTLVASILILPLRFSATRRLLVVISAGLILAFIDVIAVNVVIGTNSAGAPFLFVAIYVVVVALSIYAYMSYRQRRRLHVRELGQLLTLTPAGFEAAIADMLADMGYRSVKQVGRAGDLAADIECRDRKGRSVVVQCKRHAPGIKVSSSDVQSFLGTMTIHHGAEHGMFVTTSEFTQPAIDLARQHNVTLVDGHRLARILASAERRHASTEVDVGLA